MSSQITENANTILERAMKQLVTNTKITRVSPGSKARTILAIISNEIERLENILNANTVLSLVNGAQGIYLDFIGELVGLERGQRSASNVSSLSQNVRVYVDTGLTFGDLNNGSNITLTPGTLISSANNEFQFATRERIPLYSGDSEAFLSVRSLKPGAAGNAPRGSLTKISFEAYATYPSPSLKVENLSGIENGSEEDPDSLYRYQITNAFLSAEAGNYNAIRMGLLGLNAVADTIIMPLARGVGTADIILQTTSGEVSGATIEEANRIVEITSSLGTDIRIRKPFLIGLELGLQIKYQKGVSFTEKQQINNKVRDALAKIVLGIPMGGSIDIPSLARVIFRSDDRIIEVGTHAEPLTDIILWRDSIISSSRAPLVLFNNGKIELSADERLVLEGSLAQAIKITEKK